MLHAASLPTYEREDSKSGSIWLTSRAVGCVAKHTKASEMFTRRVGPSSPPRRPHASAYLHEGEEG